MLKLYHWEPNANSGKPILTLKEKGVEFESCWIDMRNFDQHRPEYLAINPLGVVPAMIHDDLMMYESTAIMEYVDEAFDGPPLRPSDAEECWRMRWWMKFVDQYYAPAVSMGAWSQNTLMRALTERYSPEELNQKIQSIPQRERQVSWSKAIYGTFSEQELAESRRRAAYGAALMEQHLSRHEWLAGGSYSLADINAFNLCYFMPARENGNVSDASTPYTMEWLRRIYERPATKQAWALGRSYRIERLEHLERQPAPMPGEA